MYLALRVSIQSVLASIPRFKRGFISAFSRAYFCLLKDDPLYLVFGGVDLYVDLGAEKVIAAQKENQKIAVDLKSFLSYSVITDFHQAVGQVMNYRLVIQQKEPERILYLAVPADVYKTFFQLEFTRLAILNYQLNIIIYDIEQEAILQWTN